MNSAIMKAIDEQDIEMTRILLANELFLNPSAESYYAAKKIAEEHFPDLYEKDDSQTNYQEQATWDEDYLINLKGKIDANFSKERVELYEKVVKFVLGDKTQEAKPQQNPQEQEHQRQVPQQQKAPISAQNNTIHKNYKKELYIGATIGSACICIAGLCSSKFILAGLGLVGVSLFGSILYKTYKK